MTAKYWPPLAILYNNKSNSFKLSIAWVVILSIEHFNICHSKFDSILFLVYFFHLFILFLVSKSNWNRHMICKVSSYISQLTLWNHGCFLEVILIQLIKNSRVLSLSFWWQAPGIKIGKWKAIKHNNIL